MGREEAKSVYCDLPNYESRCTEEERFQNPSGKATPQRTFRVGVAYTGRTTLTRVNTTEALVELAENLLEQYGYVRSREVIAIVAGTRTKSGSTNFLRLHVMGEQNLEGVRFFAPPEEQAAPPGAGEGKNKRAAAKGKSGSRPR